jgi:threonine/homoserine efflux transporter RhtA
LLSLEGVFAALSGWILLEQDMTAMAIMGAGFIMVAILLVELTPARRIKPSSD